MSGFRNFGLALQAASVEYARYKETREKGEEEAKRQMYALEKRHAAGETLHPMDLCYLLNLQDKHGRAPAIPDPVIVPPTLQQLIEEAKSKGHLRKANPYVPPTWGDRLTHYVIGLGTGAVATFVISIIDKVPTKNTVMGISLLLAVLFALGVLLAPEEKGDPS